MISLNFEKLKRQKEREEKFSLIQYSSEIHFSRLKSLYGVDLSFIYFSQFSNNVHFFFSLPNMGTTV